MKLHSKWLALPVLATLALLAPGLYLIAAQAKKVQVEIDDFPVSAGTLEINVPGVGTDTVTLSGPSTVHVFIGRQGQAADTDFDGLDQVETELVEMVLTGVSALLGDITVRLPEDGATKHPGTGGPLLSTGEIEEEFNVSAGRLDIEPFVENDACKPELPDGCAATSFFDVFFVVEIPSLGLILHNHVPKPLDAVITNKPPAAGETFFGADVVELRDEAHNPTMITIGEVEYTPNPLRECGATSPQCDGVCPNPSDVCVKTGGVCECVPPQPTCVGGPKDGQPCDPTKKKPCGGNGVCVP